MAVPHARVTRASLAAFAYLWIAATPSGQTSAAQDGTPTFRSGIQFVEVDVTVTDRKGNPVRDLGPDDFQIVEGDSLQSLTSFRLVDLPIPPPATGRRAPPEAIERDGASNAGQGRVYVMLLDGSGWGRVYRTKLLAKRFVDEALAPGDVMAIVHAGSSVSAGHGFTSDRARLLSSIERFRGAYEEGPDEEGTSIHERSSATGSAYEIIRSVSEQLGVLGGRRKSIIWIGGAPRLFHKDFRQAGEAFAQRDALRAASRNNVAIYPVDPLGLTTTMGSDELERQGGLRLVAEDTGGLAIVNTNNFSGNYRRIVEQNSTYYVLGYYPAAVTPDGSFHRITVRLRRPGLNVRARAGYRAVEPPPPVLPAQPAALRVSDAMESALRSPLPVPGLGLDMSLSAFRGEGDRGSVLLAVELRGADLRLDADRQIEVGQIAIDDAGRVRAAAGRIFTMTLRSADSGREGLRYYDRLDLGPGHYEVRVVAHQRGGVTGSVIGYVDVPDFRKPAVSMGGLLVASLNDAGYRSLRDDPQRALALQVDPAIGRRFRSDDTLTVWTEIYDNRRSRTGVLRVRSGIVSATGRSLTSRERPVTASAPSQSRFEFRDRFELGGIVPGDYVLNVEVQPPGKAQAIRRTIPFSIVAGP